MRKLIILCSNYEPSQFPRKPDEANRFYTYGFGAMFGKLYYNYLDKYEIEVWRTDRYCEQKYYQKIVNGITYRVYKARNVYKIGHYSLKFLSDLKKEYKENDPLMLIVHTHNWQTYLISYFIKNARMITTHHGDWSPFYVYKNSSGLIKLRALLGIIAEKIVMKNIKHFLIGDFRQIDYIRKAVKNFKYSIYSTGINISLFKPIGKEEARGLIGLDKNKKYILYVGKLYKYKQVKELLEIWNEIRNQRPEVELLLVGNESRGSWGEEYYDLAVEYGAKVIGRVLNTELYKYYSAADVYVLLGLRDDNFGGTGIAPIESLACNTPVVTSSMRNYLGDNANEICESPDSLEGYKQAILKVIDNPGLYKNMRESVEKYYSHEALVKRADKIFTEVLEN